MDANATPNEATITSAEPPANDQEAANEMVEGMQKAGQDAEEITMADVIQQASEAADDGLPGTATPAEQPPGEPTDANEPAELNPFLVQQATEMGMAEEDVAAFESDGALGRTLTMMRKYATTAPVKPGDDSGDAPSAAPSEQAKPLVEVSFDEDDEASFPGMTKAMQTLGDAVNNINAQLQTRAQTVDAFMESATESSDADKQRQFDQRVDGLGDEYAPIFGKNAVEIKDGSPELAARITLFNMKGDIEAGRRMRGQPPLPQDRLFKMALSAVASGFTKQLTRRNLEKSVKKRAENVSPVGVQGGSSAPQESRSKSLRRVLHGKAQEYGVG